MWSVNTYFFSNFLLFLTNQKNNKKTAVAHVETRDTIIEMTDFLNFIKLYCVLKIDDSFLNANC